MTACHELRDLASPRGIAAACGLPLAIALLAAPGGLRAQLPQKAPRIAPAADRVQLTSLAVSSTTPALGSTMTVQATLRNVDPNYTLNIPWTITVAGPAGTQQVGSGTASAVAPGAAVTVTASWRAVAGDHVATASADPANSLGEMAPHPANNARTTGTVTPEEVRLLTFGEAAAAGAQFASNVQGPTTCRAVGVFDASDPRFLGSQGRGRPLFIADCTTPPQSPPVVTGAKATPVAFANLTLRNGWTIRGVRVLSRGQDGTRLVGNAGGNPVTLPSAGGSSAKTEFSLFADRAAVFEALLEVTIGGPAHRNPWR
ncbi:MAG: hypothetical protein JNJ98_13005 [Gemmatimonadetes bacterium]|nr:hypothetical protein [Gemmatimonadota bacterium]